MLSPERNCDQSVKFEKAEHVRRKFVFLAISALIILLQSSFITSAYADESLRLRRPVDEQSGQPVPAPGQPSGQAPASDPIPQSVRNNSSNTEQLNQAPPVMPNVYIPPAVPSNVPAYASPVNPAGGKTPLQGGVYENGIGVDNSQFMPNGQRPLFGGGQPMQGRADSNMMQGNTGQNTLRAGTTDGRNTAGLNEVELKRFTDHDIVLIIDRSSSMNTPDCPMPNLAGKVSGVLSMFLGGSSFTSRWNWCAGEATNLAHVASIANSNAISVVLFSFNYRVYPRVAWDEVPKIFKEHHPGGSTNLAPAIDSVITDYFQRKKSSNGNVKPLAIVVITDGVPNSEGDVRRVLIETTRAMQDPREIVVNFFLIGGADPDGERFVWDLDHNLVREGARFDIVHAAPFPYLCRMGLPKALAEGLQ